MRGLLFEGLDVSKRRGKRAPWVAVVSFGLHTAAFAAVVLLPLLSTTESPIVVWAAPIPDYVPEVPRVTLTPKPPVVRQTTPVRAQRDHGVAPAAPSIPVPIEIPDAIPQANDIPPIDPSATFVVGGGCPDCPPASPETPAGGGAPEGTGVGEGPVRIVPGGIIQPPRKLKHVAPVYPPIALTARLNATVVVDCIIDTDGRVTSARVVSGHPLLNAASIEAVERWVYQPTLLNGVPVAVQMTVTLRFSQVR